MEIRVLEYFLAVAREQSITAAAESLNLTQPTLSRQLKELEEEFGKQLFIRGSRRITLTDDGMLLRKRAEEIIDLVKKTENEMTSEEDEISGDVFIGAGETDAMRIVARVAHSIQQKHQNIHFHVVSGDSVDIQEKLDKGILDFCIIIGKANTSKYEAIDLPMKDTIGLLMRKDSPLAEKEFVTHKDLDDIPLIVSRQVLNENAAKYWGIDEKKHKIAATYNLIYNASLMVDEGMGYALGLDKLINTSGNSNLCFRAFEPPVYVGMNMVWKKYQIFSAASELFLRKFKEHIEKLKSHT